MWFVSDLAKGQEYEQKVLEIIQREYPQENWTKNTQTKWVDIVSEWDKTIEVKSDFQASQTWNFFIEVECNGKPSWIFAYTSITVLAYVIIDVVYLFNIERLKEFITLHPLRKVKWWDGWRSVGILLPIQYAIDHKIISKTLKIW